MVFVICQSPRRYQFQSAKAKQKTQQQLNLTPSTASKDSSFSYLFDWKSLHFVKIICFSSWLLRIFPPLSSGLCFIYFFRKILIFKIQEKFIVPLSRQFWILFLRKKSKLFFSFASQYQSLHKNAKKTFAYISGTYLRLVLFLTKIFVKFSRSKFENFETPK